jgi:Ca-activated chloride channel family protein
MNWATFLLVAFSLFQDPYTLKLDVPVVSIDVTALDGKDNLVSNLNKNDFLIYEDGVPQEIRFFSPVSTPYHVFLLFDSSGSTLNNRDFMRNAAAKLIENLRPQDSIAVGSFADTFQLNLRWTTDHQKAAAALDAIARSNESQETHFYAALDRILRSEFKGVVGRRAVVVLTDGEDTQLLYESKAAKSVLQSSREQRIPVSIVVLPKEPATQLFFENTLAYFEDVRFNLQRIVDNSGGEILFSKDLSEVELLYEQIGRRLGTAYSLGYVPSNSLKDGTLRTIEVKSSRNSLRLIQSRKGYYAQK